MTADQELVDRTLRGELPAFRGEIEQIESAATVLRAGDGRRVRVPNHLLIDSVVTLEPRPGTE